MASPSRLTLLRYHILDECFVVKPQDETQTLDKTEILYKPDLLEKINKIQYMKQFDVMVRDPDYFGVVSNPKNKFLKLQPKSVEVSMISTEADVKKLEILLKEEWIGIDCEWNP